MTLNIKAQTIELPDNYDSPEKLCGLTDQDVANEFVKLLDSPDPGRSMVKLASEGRFKVLLFFACMGAQKMGEEVINLTANKLIELERAKNEKN